MSEILLSKLTAVKASLDLDTDPKVARLGMYFCSHMVRLVMHCCNYSNGSADDLFIGTGRICSVYLRTAAIGAELYNLPDDLLLKHFGKVKEHFERAGWTVDQTSQGVDTSIEFSLNAPSSSGTGDMAANLANLLEVPDPDLLTSKLSDPNQVQALGSSITSQLQQRAYQLQTHGVILVELEQKYSEPVMNFVLTEFRKKWDVQVQSDLRGGVMLQFKKPQQQQ